MRERRQLFLIFVISLIVGSLAAYFGYNILSEFQFYQSFSNVLSIMGFIGFLIALWIIVNYFVNRHNKLNH